MNIVHEILLAEKRIRNYIEKTALIYSPYLSQKGDCEVYLKTENLQKTGSFKIRGAFNAILSHSEEKNQSNFVTSSSGNHGIAFAYAIQTLYLKGLIFLPKTASQVKIADLKQYNSEIRFHGNDCVETEIFARKYASDAALTYISPYNDISVISGQGTIGIEIEEDLRNVDSIIVPIGGGGLISGIAGYLKNRKENIRVIGCQPENSPVMYESIKAGTIVKLDSKPTLSDGTAGGIEPNSITFDFCKEYVDDYILISEKEIKSAIRLIFTEQNMIVEGAGVLSIAAFLKNKEEFTNKIVVLIISGSKISNNDFKEIIDN